MEVLGLKYGEVSLVEPEALRAQWQAAVEQAGADWRGTLGDAVTAVEGIGGGSVEAPSLSLHTRPVVDVAVAVRSLAPVLEAEPQLEAKGYFHYEKRDTEERLFFLKKNEQGFCTHAIYVVLDHSEAHKSLLEFRDYLRVNTDKLRRYDALKQELAQKYPNDRAAYQRGKLKFLQNIAEEASDYFRLGSTVNVVVTTPLGEGSPVNVGYSREWLEETGQRQTVYLMGVQEPVQEFTGTVIAVIKRENAPDKLVAAPPGMVFYEPEIAHILRHQEEPEAVSYCCRHEKSCGAVLFTEQDGERRYLLIQNRSLHSGFPKGHIEYGEREIDTVRREIEEETGLQVTVMEGFSRSYSYPVKFFIQKTAVYLLAKFTGDTIVPQEGEVLDYWIVPFEEAMERLEFEQDRRILQDAEDFLKKQAEPAPTQARRT